MDYGFYGLAKNYKFFVRIGFLIGFLVFVGRISNGFSGSVGFSRFLVFLGSGWFFQVLVFLGSGSGSDI